MNVSHLTTKSKVSNSQSVVTSEEFLLVKRLAKFVQRRSPIEGVLDDLIQEGVLGLFDAKSKYVAKDDCSFNSYASVRIKSAMLDFLRKEDHVSRSVRDKTQQLKKARLKLSHQLKAAPTLRQLSEEMNMELESVAKLINTHQDTVSIEDTNTEMVDKIADHEELDENREQSDQLAAHLEKLTERERKIIKWRYEDELSFADIAENLRVSTSMCTQLHRNSLKKLSQMMQ